MKKIFRQITAYARTTPLPPFFASALLMSLTVFINYRIGLSARIEQGSEAFEWCAWFGLFLLLYLFPYLLSAKARQLLVKDRLFLFLCLLGPALFAWKMSYTLQFPVSARPELQPYWNRVLYWPFKLLVMGFLLWFVWKRTGPPESFYGLTVKGLDLRPYGLMLLFMVPLIAAAATQPDFLQTYPKSHLVNELPQGERQPWRFLLYEAAYGSDFIGIELFFRGFLVLAFARFVGPGAILPMAMFYCAIHFGKPLGECISSFFGGIFLGVVTYHSRSIIGGLAVHLGIAWLMELGGTIGRYWAAG
ncbi:MAG TPA: CPBP family intramembrane glutamic endopeptidase [Chitinophagaceae bacterium]|jgi:hypothetical protein|nr:CPBP family intramembrane glutamic endopeptidase [Chitinophagaceae bacterium]